MHAAPPVNDCASDLMRCRLRWRSRTGTRRCLTCCRTERSKAGTGTSNCSLATRHRQREKKQQQGTTIRRMSCSRRTLPAPYKRLLVHWWFCVCNLTGVDSICSWSANCASLELAADAASRSVIAVLSALDHAVAARRLVGGRAEGRDARDRESLGHLRAHLLLIVHRVELRNRGGEEQRTKRNKENMQKKENAA